MSDPYAKARRHLQRRDPVLKRLIAAVGPCTLQPTADGFAALVRSIISQQISAKAARSICGRLEALLGPGGMTPAAILAQEEAALQSVGLSKAKARYVRDLAEKVQTGVVPLADLPQRDDEDVIASLVQVHGIGRWTAEMYLIFSLGRLDVLPVDDLGVRAAAQSLYDLQELPGKLELTRLAEPWRPYRSIASWYLWRSRGFVPASGLSAEEHS